MNCFHTLRGLNMAVRLATSHGRQSYLHGLLRNALFLLEALMPLRPYRRPFFVSVIAL